MMTILDNDLANAVQAERRAQAAAERLGDQVRATAPQAKSRVGTRRYASEWLQIWIPLGCVVLAR
jgi:hypothetical protein